MRNDEQIRTLTDIFEEISHHSLSTRFDMFQPIYGRNLKNENKWRKSKTIEETINVPIESGIKIPIPRLG